MSRLSNLIVLILNVTILSIICCNALAQVTTVKIIEYMQTVILLNIIYKFIPVCVSVTQSENTFSVFSRQSKHCTIRYLSSLGYHFPPLNNIIYSRVQFHSVSTLVRWHKFKKQIRFTLESKCGVTKKEHCSNSVYRGFVKLTSHI